MDLDVKHCLSWETEEGITKEEAALRWELICNDPSVYGMRIDKRAEEEEEVGGCQSETKRQGWQWGG